MISRETVAIVVEVLDEWRRDNDLRAEPVRVLLSRLSNIKGSKSFTDSMSAIESEFNDHIYEENR